MYKRLLRCVREYKTPTFLTLLFIALEAVLECFIPATAAQLINSVQNGAVMEDIIRSGIQLILMAVASLCCGAIAGYTCAKASCGFAKNLRHDVFQRIQTFSFENMDKFSSASLVTRMTTDINNAQMSYMMLIRIAVRAPLLLIFSTVMAFTMGGNLAFAFVVIIPLLAGGLLAVARLAMPAFRRVFKKYDRLNESIEENVRAMRVVKGFSREDYEKKKFHTAAEDICADFTKAERIVALNGPIMQITIYSCIIAILWFGGQQIMIGSMQTGDLMAYFTYIMQIMMSLMMVSMIFVMLIMSKASGERIAEVLTEESTLQNPAEACCKVADGSIEFEDVSFGYYKGKDCLKNISISIPAGSVVGILGGTGSAKSTLVSLIPRLYEANEGEVRVGGHNIKKYTLEQLRDAVAMVLQKNTLFSGSIRENLRWGRADATDEEIAAACRAACAEEFINSFPDGYDTHIEQGGSNVSGGQKQRLCIARAILRKPKILIFDDSTSAVDTATDARIREALRRDLPGVTKIIIAQRVSSIADADLILVMDDGRISAMGTHEELLRSSSIYREVYQQQQEGVSLHG